MGSCSWAPTVASRCALGQSNTGLSWQRPTQGLLPACKLTSTRESINGVKTALEHGLKEMESSRNIVTSQLTLATGSDQEEVWVEALQQIRSLGQHAESRLAKSAELDDSENIFIRGGKI